MELGRKAHGSVVAQKPSRSTATLWKRYVYSATPRYVADVFFREPDRVS